MKHVIILALSLASFINVTAQKKISHSVGVTISVIDGKIKTPYGYGEGFYEDKVSIMQSSATYFPRYNIMENEKSSISVGVPISLGIGIYNNQFDDDPRIGFSYDFPLALDYNLGLQSSESNESGIGAYIGAGFGYHGISISGGEGEKIKVNTYGPIARLGFRFGRSAPVTIGLQYKKGLEKEKYSTIGCVVLYHL